MNAHLTRPLKATLASIAATTILTIVSLTPAQAAKSQCASGNFCVWTGVQYSGRIQQISDVNEYEAITLGTTRSYFNNRSKRSWLHEKANGTGTYTCINPGGSSASTSGWQQTAKGAFLATLTTC